MTVRSDRVIDATTRLVQTLIERGEVKPAELPEVVERIGVALSRVEGQLPSAPAETAPEAVDAPAGGPERSGQAPAVPIAESVTPDYLICLEDGRKMQMLKRHLKTRYGMTPEQYRAKWGLPDDYPMVAPRYSAVRRQMATRTAGGAFTGTSRSDAEQAGSRAAA